MVPVSILVGRLSLRDFTDADRAAFIGYQMDPRYLDLYDFRPDAERPGGLFDLFLEWQREEPRSNFQLGVFDAATGQLLGCGGLRKADQDTAILGLELAPSEWGRFRVALDVAAALLRLGFETLNFKTIMGDTASGNRRVEKLARWFGARIAEEREGPLWMQSRGWREVDWAITREAWKERLGRSGAL